MKKSITFTLCLLFFIEFNISAQGYPAARDSGMMQFKQQRYLEALNSFIYADKLYDARKFPKDKNPQKWIKECQDSIRNQNFHIKAEQTRAENEKHYALVQKIRADSLLNVSDSALARAEKLIDAFYFYNKRFALAYKNRRFYFIDKNGNPIEKLGKWEKAEQFNMMGFAKVNERKNECYLDTNGITYPVAYDIKDLTSKITFLDLQAKVLFLKAPKKLFKNYQLKVLILSYNQLSSLPAIIGNLCNLIILKIDYNNLKNIPVEIGNLSNLIYLSLNGNGLTSLPPEIGKLSNLTYLYLWNNNLNTLPEEIKKLTSLKELYLGGNNFTKIEKQKIQQWLPNCKIDWVMKDQIIQYRK
jgi:hypothetical protein